MVPRTLARGTACAVLLATTAAAQDFQYPDFSNVAGLTLNGNAAPSGSELRVTPSASAQKGSVFRDQPVRVTDGFATVFQFRITAQSGGGADGMALVLHNAADGLSALGDDGSGMGCYENGTTGGSIENSLVLELDTWNSGFGDPDDNHVGLHTGGTGENHYDEAYALARASAPMDLSDGAVHTAAVRYSGGALTVYVDDLTQPLFTVPYDFATGGSYLSGGSVGGLNLIGGDSLWAGFTAGTGGAWENHDVLSWTWTDGDAGVPYCGPAVPNSTGASAHLAGVGSEIVALNDLTLVATSLPPGRFAVLLNSLTTGFTSGFGGGQGNLCLGGTPGVHAGLVGKADAGGTFARTLDLTAVPTAAGPVVVQAGETWHWQCWYRDVNPTKTSNFTDALEITFR